MYSLLQYNKEALLWRDLCTVVLALLNRLTKECLIVGKNSELFPEAISAMLPLWMCHVRN